MMKEPNKRDPFRGLRILIVEDNYLVAMSLARMLAEWGCEVIGPAPSVEEGSRLVDEKPLSGAILDINIRGGSSAPIAERLREKGRPFFFITGYGSPQFLPEHLRKRRRINKPLASADLREAILAEFLAEH